MAPKAPRNKTIQLTEKEIGRLAAQAIKLKSKVGLDEVIDRVIWQDAFRALDKLPDACVDLMIVDPPYNLTKNFGSSVFKEMKNDEYAFWLDKWLKKTVRLLKDNASIYICADWKSSIAIPYIAGKYFVLFKPVFRGREKKAAARKITGKTALKTYGFSAKAKITNSISNG